MRKKEIIEKMKELRLPDGEYIVFGSCPLAIAGLRESSDIDLLVTPKLMEDLKKTGWRLTRKDLNDKPYIRHGAFEAHTSWEFSTYKPTLQSLLETATVVEDISFASIDEVRKWKLASGRPKDRRDIDLIDKYYSQFD